jgi:hypothetical protein
MKRLKWLISKFGWVLDSIFGVAFDRPIGAIADVTELEYCSALHQTDVPGGIRKDGSIQGESKWNVQQWCSWRILLFSSSYCRFVTHTSPLPLMGIPLIS